MWSWVALGGYLTAAVGIGLEWGAGPALIFAGALAVLAGLRGEQAEAEAPLKESPPRRHVVLEEIHDLGRRQQESADDVADGWVSRLRKRGGTG